MTSGNFKHILTLGNSIIGVSVLAMPYCFKQCGIILGILMLIISGLMTKLTCHFLVKSAILTRRHSYEFLAFDVFGAVGKFAVEVIMIGFLVGICISFFVIMGDLGPQIMAKTFSVDNSSSLRSMILTALAMFVALPLGLLRNIESLASVCAVSIAFYLFLVLKILLEAVPYLHSGDWVNKVELWRPAGILQTLPIFGLALACQTNLFEIFDSLPERSLKKMNTVVSGAVNMCTAVYILVGFFGYVAYHDTNFSGNILMSLRSSIVTESIKFGFVLSVALSFPLIIFPCRTSIHSLLYRRSSGGSSLEMSNNFIPENRFRCITVALLGSSLVVGILVPNIEMVLGLLGSTMGTAIAIIFPAVIFLKVLTKNTTERFLAQVMFFIGIGLLICGTYTNLYAVNEVVIDPRVNLQPIINTSKHEGQSVKDAVEETVDKPDQAAQTREKRLEPANPVPPSDEDEKPAVPPADEKKEQEALPKDEKLAKKDGVNEGAQEAGESNAEKLVQQMAKQQKELLDEQKNLMKELKEYHRSIKEQAEQPKPLNQQVNPQLQVLNPQPQANPQLEALNPQPQANPQLQALNPQGNPLSQANPQLQALNPQANPQLQALNPQANPQLQALNPQANPQLQALNPQANPQLQALNLQPPAPNQQANPQPPVMNQPFAVAQPQSQQFLPNVDNKELDNLDPGGAIAEDRAASPNYLQNVAKSSVSDQGKVVNQKGNIEFPDSPNYQKNVYKLGAGGSNVNPQQIKLDSQNLKPNSQNKLVPNSALDVDNKDRLNFAAVDNVSINKNSNLLANNVKAKGDASYNQADGLGGAQRLPADTLNQPPNKDGMQLLAAADGVRPIADGSQGINADNSNVQKRSAAAAVNSDVRKMQPESNSNQQHLELPHGARAKRDTEQMSVNYQQLPNALNEANLIDPKHHLPVILSNNLQRKR